jgi:hypothetical protein
MSVSLMPARSSAATTARSSGKTGSVAGFLSGSPATPAGAIEDVEVGGGVGDVCDALGAGAHAATTTSAIAMNRRIDITTGVAATWFPRFENRHQKWASSRSKIERLCKFIVVEFGGRGRGDARQRLDYWRRVPENLLYAACGSAVRLARVPAGIRTSRAVVVSLVVSLHPVVPSQAHLGDSSTPVPALLALSGQPLRIQPRGWRGWLTISCHWALRTHVLRAFSRSGGPPPCAPRRSSLGAVRRARRHDRRLS